MDSHIDFKISDSDVLFCDNHCFVVHKPPRLLTTEDKTEDTTLESLAKEYVKNRFQKPGNVYLSLIHRIDRPVSGAVLFARTSKAAARLSESFRKRLVLKTYIAVVEGKAPQGTIKLNDTLIKDSRTNQSRVGRKDESRGVNAELSFECLNTSVDLEAKTHIKTKKILSLLQVSPITGRSHQIRVQLSHFGLPIVGDRKYGAELPFLPGSISLHSYGLSFPHPTSQEMVHVTAPLPAEWRHFFKETSMKSCLFRA